MIYRNAKATDQRFGLGVRMNPTGERTKNRTLTSP